MILTHQLHHDTEQERVAAVAEAAGELQYAGTRVARRLRERGDKEGLEALDQLLDILGRLQVVDVEDPWDRKPKADPERRGVGERLRAAYRAAKREIERG